MLPLVTPKHQGEGRAGRLYLASTCPQHRGEWRPPRGAEGVQRGGGENLAKGCGRWQKVRLGGDLQQACCFLFIKYIIACV